MVNLAVILQTGGSSQNYNIFQELCGFPVLRHVIKVKAMRGEQLYLPGSCIENFQAAKRMVDMWKRAGPLALQTDCTKLNPDIAFATDFAHEERLFGHIVGTTLPLEDVEVWNAASIKAVISKVKRSGQASLAATYLRVTVLKIPMPALPPIVVAAYGTANNETGQDGFEHLALAQSLCEAVGLPLLSNGANWRKGRACSSASLS